MNIITTFSEIQALEISKKGDLLLSVSKFGNKIHIYSLDDFQLKFCLFLTSSEQKVLNSAFNQKSRFFTMLSYNGEELNLSIFDLKHSSREDQLCQCSDYDDEEINLISSVKENQHSLFGNFMHKLSNVSDVLFFYMLKF